MIYGTILILLTCFIRLSLRLKEFVWTAEKSIKNRLVGVCSSTRYGVHDADYMCLVVFLVLLLIGHFGRDYTDLSRGPV